MNGRFMQLWLANERQKQGGASGLAAPPAPQFTPALDASIAKMSAPADLSSLKGAADAAGGAASKALGRYPTVHGGPPSAAGDSIMAGVQRDLAPLRQASVAAKPAEGSLEWFDQASPEEMMALVNRTRSMVKTGR